MGQIHNIEKLTDCKFLNLYHLNATSIHNTPVSYFVASRAKSINELKIKTGKNTSGFQPRERRRTMADDDFFRHTLTSH